MVHASGEAVPTQAVGQLSTALAAFADLLHRRWKLVLAVGAAVGLLGEILAWGSGWFYLVGMVMTGGLAVTISWRLSVALRASEQNAAELMEAYTDSLHELERRESGYRRRLHDARSTAVGIRAAVELMGPRPSGGPDHAARLRWSIQRELDRLQSLLDADEAEAMVDFDLAAALDPVVLAHRTLGTPIEVVAEPVVTHGRPHATSSVLDNLLRNAGLHAPGAHVQVRVSDNGSQAVVVVDDDGPGVPDEIADKVLLPGVRGGSSGVPGHGLGLHNASVTITEQSGRLWVGPRPGGGTRVRFTLPLAVEQPARDDKPRLAG